jgi:hypothetical protein
VLWAALLISGCGSTVTKHDVIKRANAICANTLRDVRALVPPTPSGNRGGRFSVGVPDTRYLNALAGLIQTEAGQLSKLPRPARDRALLSQYIAAVDRVAAGYRRLATASKQGSNGRVAAILSALRANPAPALATRYGMTVCAGSSGTAVAR